MDLKYNIIIAIVVVIVLYWIYLWFTSGAKTKLSTMSNAKKPITVDAGALPANSHSNNYTYSMWIYVNNWNYRFGNEKVIIQREGTSPTNMSPKIALDPIKNNIVITTEYYTSGSSGATGTTAANRCTVENIPIQRWVNVIVSLNGRTMDTYINGKLTKTCVLPGVPTVNKEKPVQITPTGTGGSGFDGWTSEITYRAFSINPQEAWNIYSEGYGGNILGNLLGKYSVKVSFMEDNVDRGSFQI